MVVRILEADVRVAGAPAGLAVKACHAAIAANSLEVVDKAVEFLGAHKEAWPALSLELLTKLARRFPQQAVSLLAQVDLTLLEESTFDNVLPFRLRSRFRAIAVSNHDELRFGQQSAGDNDGLSLSTKDAEYFSNESDRDPPIEATLLQRPATWLGLTLLFDWRELFRPTVRLMLRVVGCVSLAFMLQGPASFVMVAVGYALIFALGILTRVGIWAVTLPLGLINGAWGAVITARRRRKVHPLMAAKAESIWSAFTTGFDAPHFNTVNRLLGWGRGSTVIACRKVPMAIDFRRQRDSMLLEALLQARDVPSSVFNSKVVRALISFKWQYFTKYFLMMQLLLHFIYMVVFLVYGFSVKDLQPINGRQGSSADMNEQAGARGSGPGGNSEDAGSISGGGGGVIFGVRGPPTCQLPAPTALELGYLCVLGGITIDLATQEIRQMLHFSKRYFLHAWDILDIMSVVLMSSIIVAHFMCSLGPLLITPEQLRGMISGQALLLFMRLLYFAMAFEELGAFVSMVLSTFGALLVFALFLVIVVVGFAVSIILAQGPQEDGESQWKGVIMKLYTMIYGDFDLDFMDGPWATGFGDGGPTTTLITVFIALFMLVVTIVLLNLLIAIVNESYDKIRATVHFESLRNKALLIVCTEALMQKLGIWWPFMYLARCFCKADGEGGGDGEGDAAGDGDRHGDGGGKGDGGGVLVNWVYTTLSAPLPDASTTSQEGGSNGGLPKNKYDRYLYVITPERIQVEGREGSSAVVGGADEDDGARTGRLGDIREIVAEQVETIVRLLEKPQLQQQKSIRRHGDDSGAGSGDEGDGGGGGRDGDSGGGGGIGGGTSIQEAADEAVPAASAAATAVAAVGSLSEDEIRRIADLVAELQRDGTQTTSGGSPNLNTGVPDMSPGGQVRGARKLAPLPPINPKVS